jgi:hypothetical protein
MRPKRGKTFIYVSSKKYDGMMGRCYRKSDPSYPFYGAKGIAVCSAWIKDINSFRSWLLGELDKKGIGLEKFVKESKYFQLDRINGKGHYTPENCRLVSPQQNQRNKNGYLVSVLSAEGEQIELRKQTP